MIKIKNARDDFLTLGKNSECPIRLLGILTFLANFQNLFHLILGVQKVDNLRFQLQDLCSKRFHNLAMETLRNH